MIALDLHTVVVICLIGYLVCTLFVAQLWRQSSAHFAGIDLWAAGFVLQTLSLALTASRGVLPNWAPVLLADILALAGFVMLYSGLERFARQPGPQFRNIVFFILAGVGVLASSFASPDWHSVGLVRSVFLTIICLQCLWLLRRRVDPAMRRVASGVALVFAGYCALGLLRIAPELFAEHAGSNYLQSGAFELLVVAGDLMLAILLTLALVQMVNRRLVGQVRAERERFARAFHAAPLASALIRLSDRTIVDVNETFESLIGCHRKNLIGRPASALQARDHSEDAAAAFRILEETGAVRGMELRFRKETGQTVVGLFSAEVIPMDGDKRVLACITDITERKQAELALRETLNLLRCVVESVPARVFWKDRESRYLGCNVQFANDAGLASPDELRGKTDFDMGWKDQAELYRADDRAVMESDVPKVDYEEPQTTPDGETIWLRTSKVPLRDESNQVVGIMGTYQDITRHKAAEEQLRKLSLAVEQSPESIVITDVSAVIEYVNDAFVRASGYSREEAIGRNPRFLHSGKTPPATFLALWAALGQGRSWKGEFLNRRKDGSEYLEFAIITPLRQADGAISHYVALKEDITERKRIGRELDAHRHRLEDLAAARTKELVAARQQAEAANQAKSSFLANMSHEIRTPMNAIIGLTHLMRRAGATPEQALRLDRIDSAGRHLLSIINDILDLSKIEAGRMQIESTDFHLSAILDNVASIIGEAAREKGLEIRLESDAVPRWLRGDPTRVRQALLNFAGNAVKFTEEGSIVLRARLIEDSTEEMLVRFEVQDTGIGIAADALPRMFEAFEQADPSTTRNYGGTGLGLAITRRIAQLMGGEVGADSTPGIGSTFWFTARLQRGRGVMPAAESPQQAGDAEASLRQRHGNARLLLAEDHPINREVALELLSGVHLTVDTAADGEEAVKMARAHPYDLILMDIQMPKMDGLEASRAIRAMPDRAATPIVAMTANAFDEDRHACQNAGISDFIAKPVEPKALYATLLKWLPDEQTVEHAPVTFASPRRPDRTGPALPRALTDFGGLDVDRGLALLNGNAPAYLGLLRRFAATHRDDVPHLREELAAGRVDAVRQRAHALKGAAATLGATQLHAIAVALEQALHGGETAQAGALLEALRDGQTALDAALAQIPKPEIVGDFTADPDRTRAVLEQLEPLLASDDTAAEGVFESNRALLVATLGAGAMQLERQVADFDYPAALVTAREVMRHVASAIEERA